MKFENQRRHLSNIVFLPVRFYVYCVISLYASRDHFESLIIARVRGDADVQDKNSIAEF